MVTKRVRVVFSSGAVEKDVSLGPLATDAYYCETARAQVCEQRDNLGRFRHARIIDDGFSSAGGAA